MRVRHAVVVVVRRRDFFIIIDAVFIPVAPQARIVRVRVVGVPHAIAVAVRRGFLIVIDAVAVPVTPPARIIRVRVVGVRHVVTVTVQLRGWVRVFIVIDAVAIPITPEVRIIPVRIVIIRHAVAVVVCHGLLIVIDAVVIPVAPQAGIIRVRVIGVPHAVAVAVIRIGFLLDPHFPQRCQQYHAELCRIQIGHIFGGVEAIAGRDLHDVLDGRAAAARAQRHDCHVQRSIDAQPADEGLVCGGGNGRQRGKSLLRIGRPSFHLKLDDIIRLKCLGIKRPFHGNAARQPRCRRSHTGGRGEIGADAHGIGEGGMMKRALGVLKYRAQPPFHVRSRGQCHGVGGIVSAHVDDVARAVIQRLECLVRVTVLQLVPHRDCRVVYPGEAEGGVVEQRGHQVRRRRERLGSHDDDVCVIGQGRRRAEPLGAQANVISGGGRQGQRSAHLGVSEQADLEFVVFIPCAAGLPEAEPVVDLRAGVVFPRDVVEAVAAGDFGDGQVFGFVEGAAGEEGCCRLVFGDARLHFRAIVFERHDPELQGDVRGLLVQGQHGVGAVLSLGGEVVVRRQGLAALHVAPLHQIAGLVHGVVLPGDVPPGVGVAFPAADVTGGEGFYVGRGRGRRGFERPGAAQQNPKHPGGKSAAPEGSKKWKGEIHWMAGKRGIKPFILTL